MARRREGERDDLLRRGPRLSRRPCSASLNPQRRSLDRPSTRIPLRPPDPSSRAHCPLCHSPLHDPPGCDYLVLLHSLPHPSYLSSGDASADGPEPWRPFALSRGCESRVPAVYGERIAKEPSEILSNEPQASNLP